MILDQLEEFFVYHGVDGPRRISPRRLRTSSITRESVSARCSGIREESLARLDAFKPQLPNVLANYLRLEHLERAAARGAITEPLRRFEELGGGHWVIEPLLVEAVLDEVSAGQIDGGAAPPGHIETPYLQLVMQRLWEAEREEGSSVLRLETLRKLGGAQRIVREHLERALAALTPVEQDAAARMFRHLVTPSGAKIAHHVGDLVSYAGIESAAARGVITRLEGERIVRPIEHGRVEIYHDVLGDPISTWRRNYEATREVRRARRRARRLGAVAAGSVIALVMVSAIAVYALSQRRVAREKAALAQKAVARADDAKARAVRSPPLRARGRRRRPRARSRPKRARPRPRTHVRWPSRKSSKQMTARSRRRISRRKPRPARRTRMHSRRSPKTRRETRRMRRRTPSLKHGRRSMRRRSRPRARTTRSSKPPSSNARHASTVRASSLRARRRR